SFVLFAIRGDCRFDFHPEDPVAIAGPDNLLLQQDLVGQVVVHRPEFATEPLDLVGSRPLCYGVEQLANKVDEVSDMKTEELVARLLDRRPPGAIDAARIGFEALSGAVARVNLPVARADIAGEMPTEVRHKRTQGL